MGCSDGMEPGDDDKKKLSDEFVDFVRKRSETDTPRYTARLKTYVDIKRKRDRADAARRHYEGGHDKTHTAARMRADEDQKDKAPGNTEHANGVKDRISRSSFRSESGETSEGSYRGARAGGRGSSSSDAEPDPFCVEPFLATRLPGRLAVREGDKVMARARSVSRSRSGEPSDRGCMRMRRRRRRRRRSCGRRRRRQRSCGRRRRRRRRGCRRRRRRSCRRRHSRRRRRRSCSRRRRRCRRRR